MADNLGPQLSAVEGDMPGAAGRPHRRSDNLSIIALPRVAT
jgi:hypothetical protein